MTAPKRKNKIPAKKLKSVAELENLIKTKKTMLIASIKGVPAADFQLISKKLRGKAIVKVPKKNILFRAIEESKSENAKKLQEKLISDFAILFSDDDAFDLSAELLESKTPAKAKPGMEAPEDIKIEAGPTSLVPGPAISELGAVGLQVEVKDGKLNIRQSKVIVKKGDKISEKASAIMAKLDIKPFTIGLTPVAAMDTKENKIYLEIKIDRKETLEKLKQAYGKALPFAVGIGYASPDTIGFLLAKAEMNAKALMKFEKVNSGEEK